MATILFPSSAAPFAPRSTPSVVLNAEVEPWLTITLKRVYGAKRQFNNASRQTRFLTETLSSQNAIWTLCSLFLPKIPKSKRKRDDNSFIESLDNYQLIHIEAYVVYIDVVFRNEVAFKLTPETIETLVEFHKDVYSVDLAATAGCWPGKEKRLKRLHDEFVEAANKFICLTNALALQALEEDGSGELICGRSEKAKAAILSLFNPVLLPPSRIADFVRVAPSSTFGHNPWYHEIVQHPAPNESWEVVRFRPNTAITGDTYSNTAGAQPAFPSSSHRERYTISQPLDAFPL